MNKWKKFLDIINEVHGTNIKMGEEFSIINDYNNPYKINENGLSNTRGCSRASVIISLLHGKCKITQNPKKFKPKMNEKYFIPSLGLGDMYLTYYWDNDVIDIWCLENNLFCKTEEEAIEKAKLMLKVLESEEV